MILVGILLALILWLLIITEPTIDFTDGIILWYYDFKNNRKFIRIK